MTLEPELVHMTAENCLALANALAHDVHPPKAMTGRLWLKLMPAFLEFIEAEAIANAGEPDDVFQGAMTSAIFNTASSMAHLALPLVPKHCCKAKFLSRIVNGTIANLSFMIIAAKAHSFFEALTPEMPQQDEAIPPTHEAPGSVQ